MTGPQTPNDITAIVVVGILVFLLLLGTVRRRPQ